jgi:hypothetical protein
MQSMRWLFSLTAVNAILVPVEYFIMKSIGDGLRA